MGLRTKKGSPFAIFVIVLSLVALLFSLFLLTYYSYSEVWDGERHEIAGRYSDFTFISEWELDEVFEDGSTADVLLACSQLSLIAASGLLLITGLVLFCGGSKKLLLLPTFFLLVASALYTAGILTGREGGFSMLFKPYALLWAPCLLLFIITILNTCTSIRTPAPLAFFGIVLAIAVAVLSLFVGEWFLGQIIDEYDYRYKYIDISRIISYCGVMLGVGVAALTLTSAEGKSYGSESAASMQTATTRPAESARPVAPVQRFDPMTGRPIAPAAPVQRFDPMTGRPITPAAPVQRFDPMTGRPITPAAPAQRFDPMTGKPILQTRPVSRAVHVPETPRSEAEEEAPIKEHIAAFVQSETEKEKTQRAEEHAMQNEQTPVERKAEEDALTEETSHYEPVEAVQTFDDIPTQESASQEMPAEAEEAPAEEAAEAVQETAAPEEKRADVDYVRVLQQLQQMKELGLINDDEYAAKKAMILEKM